MAWHTDHPKGRASIVGHKPMSLNSRHDSQRHSIVEDVERSWDPLHRVNDRELHFILGILIEANSITQIEVLGRMVTEYPDMKTGTAQAKVSAALLYFRQEGWIEFIGKERRSNLWRMIA